MSRPKSKPYPWWLVRDTERERILIDVQGAALAGAGEVEVSYQEETNTIAVEVRKASQSRR